MSERHQVVLEIIHKGDGVHIRIEAEILCVAVDFDGTPEETIVTNSAVEHNQPTFLAFSALTPAAIADLIFSDSFSQTTHAAGSES